MVSKNGNRTSKISGANFANWEELKGVSLSRREPAKAKLSKNGGT